MNPAALARLRKNVRRHARDGWVRAVFARPGSSEQARVVDGPGAGKTPDETTLAGLVDAAERAAEEGLVKQTFVLDERTRVRVDARYGKAKVVRLDEARVAKAMGGKDRHLRPDVSGELLRVIGIMNADGSIPAGRAKKYKQVGHLVELCRPTLERLRAGREVSDSSPLRVLDLACGNSYLTFVLAEALRLDDVPARLHGVDVREDVVARSRERAQQLGFSQLSFEVAAIRDVAPQTTPLGGTPDLVVALHACDTASDEALAAGVHAGAPAIFCAPCCQAELATQLAIAPVDALLDRGLLKREYAAVLTDALRVEMLEACGYKVDVVEFVGSGHTPKNMLLRAHRRDPGVDVHPAAWSLDAVRARCDALRVRPRLLGLLAAAR